MDIQIKKSLLLSSKIRKAWLNMEKEELIKNEKNMTLGPTLNRCMDYVEGKSKYYGRLTYA